MEINIWTNKKIVAGCISSDPEARRVLYDKYSAQMYSVCMRYAQDSENANDMFQDGFYLVYKNIHQLKNVDALSGWIKRIFINTAIKHCKMASRTILYQEIKHANISSVDWNEAESNLGTEEITKLIQELPVGCRTVFNLYVIEGYSHNEIAEQMEISIGTSKSQLHDARKILKQKLADISKIKRTIPSNNE